MRTVLPHTRCSHNPAFWNGGLPDHALDKRVLLWSQQTSKHAAQASFKFGTGDRFSGAQGRLA